MFVWTKYLATNILILKIGGLWLIETRTRFYSQLSRLYSVFILFFFLILVVVFQSVDLFFHSQEASTFLQSSCLMLQEVQFLVKVYCVMKNFQLLQEILWDLNKEPVFQPKNQHQELLSLTGLLSWRKSFIILNIAAFITAFSWTLFPVLDNLTKQHEFPFRCWFPYDTRVSPFYEISYVYLFIHLWLGAFMTHNIDTLVTALMTFIGLQCDLLCDNLRNIGWRKTEDTIDFRTEFFSCVQHHKKILRLSQKCLTFFSLVVFIQFATISICIGISLLVLTVIPAFTTEFYHVFFYILTITLQMFQYCWFGNEVLIKSDKIAPSAFLMNFIDAPIKVRQGLIFFMLRTQKPIKIPILKLSFLTLETFIKILRTAWSYFALLHEVSTEN